MKRKGLLFFLLISLLFSSGYICGVWLHPYLNRYLQKEDPIVLTHLFGDNVVDVSSGKNIPLDTLSAHKRNLLVFWEPSCFFCRQFFQNRLNSEVIGIFCFPITDDWEYVDYFTKKNEINYPQLVRINEQKLIPTNASFVNATPMFIITDSYGKILHKQIGIIGIDDLIATLYQSN